MHAATLANELGVKKVIIPYIRTFSAWGMLAGAQERFCTDPIDEFGDLTLNKVKEADNLQEEADNYFREDQRVLPKTLR